LRKTPKIRVEETILQDGMCACTCCSSHWAANVLAICKFVGAVSALVSLQWTLRKRMAKFPAWLRFLQISVHVENVMVLVTWRADKIFHSSENWKVKKQSSVMRWKHQSKLQRARRWKVKEESTLSTCLRVLSIVNKDIHTCIGGLWLTWTADERNLKMKNQSF